MKYGNRALAWMCRGLFGGMVGFFTVLLLLIMIIAEKNEGYLATVLLLSSVLAIFWLFLAWQWQEDAPGEMTPEGVYVRVFIRRRFYPWSSIRQAGILWRLGRYCRYNEIVLLKQNGSRRGYRDGGFLARNFFKIIHLPHSEAARAYIVAHYGPLDFDLSDGRPEQSQLVEAEWMEEEVR